MMNEAKLEPMGKIKLARQLFEDCDRIDLMQEKILVSKAYFELAKTEKPVDLVVEKSHPIRDGDFTPYLPRVATIYLGRKKFLALYLESRNVLAYKEVMGVIPG